MAHEVFLRPKARQDLIEQALYIGEENRDAADRFLRAVERALDALAHLPEMGASRQFDNPALEGIRMWPVGGFEKHLIFYRLLETGIEVIRILHAARDLQAIMADEEG